MTIRTLSLALSAAVLLASGTASADREPIPQSMRGTWGWDAKSCADKTNDGRVLVEANRVEFFASTFRITHRSYNVSVDKTDADGTVHLQGLRLDEGNAAMFPDSLTLKLIVQDQLQIDEPDHAYMRCEN